MSSALEPPLVSLAVTHVYYNPSDPISLLSAYLALIPQALMVIYVTLIYARREIEVALMFTGQVLCELANWILKRIIKEERPKGTVPRACTLTKKFLGGGMVCRVRILNSCVSSPRTLHSIYYFGIRLEVWRVYLGRGKLNCGYVIYRVWW
jgi:hypothetical protein